MCFLQTSYTSWKSSLRVVHIFCTRSSNWTIIVGHGIVRDCSSFLSETQPPKKFIIPAQLCSKILVTTHSFSSDLQNSLKKLVKIYVQIFCKEASDRTIVVGASTLFDCLPFLS